MAILILILALLWAAFFAWPFVERRLRGAHRDPVRDFSKRLTSIGRIGGHDREPRPVPITIPTRRAAGRPVGFTASATLRRSGLPTSAAARKRRRDVLVVAAAAALGTLLLAVALGGTLLWVLQIVADLALVGYVVLLVQLRRRADAQRAVVRHLPERPASQASSLVLRREPLSS